MSSPTPLWIVGLREFMTSNDSFPVTGNGDGKKCLEPAETSSKIKKMKGWVLSADKNQINKSYLLADFLSGAALIKLIADKAEEMNHHPDLHLESYRRLTVCLTTHSAQGLTEKDFILAEKIDELSKDFEKA